MENAHARRVDSSSARLDAAEHVLHGGTVGRLRLEDGSDGVVRPVIECLVTGSDARQVDEHFFVDSCADCTVLSADLVKKPNLSGKPPPATLSLKGISGAGDYVVVNAVIEFLRVDGGPARVRGEIGAQEVELDWLKVACGYPSSAESGLRPFRLASKRRDFFSLSERSY